MPPARRDVVHVSGSLQFRERRACTGCRAIKSRCMLRPGSVRCSRCHRLGLSCVIPEHHRGVRQQGRNRQAVDGSRNTDGQPETVTNPFSIQSLLATDAAEDSSLLSSTAYATIQEARPKLERLTEVQVVVPIGDIVARNIVSESEAGTLIEFFYEHLNPIVALLDPQIYSHIRLLQRPEYRLLLASICTVSAKFCMPQHYAECLQFLDPALAMIAAGDVPPHLETVHSLSLLAMWKHPKDGVSWRKLRLAVTLAFELGLHRSFQQSSQLREDIQAQRSFLQLACFEDGYKDQCGMPLSIDASFLPEPWKWIESLGDAVQSIDIRLAASRENALVKQQLIRQLADSSEVSKAACLQKVRLINTAIAAEERNAHAWMDPTVYGLPCQHSGRPCLLFHTTNTLFNYYRALHAVYCAPALTTFVELREGTFLKCCELSIELFELFNGPYGEYEYYRFVHDIVILNLAVAAVWISDNWQVMPTSLAHQAIAAVCSAAAITAASCERKLEQASYLARFLAFCTTKFSAFATSEGKTGNDEISPTDPDAGTGQALEHAPEGRGDTLSPSPVYVQSDATRYLQELLTAPCIQVSNDAIDTNSILSFFQESTWH